MFGTGLVAASGAVTLIKETMMKSTDIGVTWLRSPAQAADLTLGCPPKVDAPEMQARPVQVPQGCPPKVD